MYDDYTEIWEDKVEIPKTTTKTKEDTFPDSILDAIEATGGLITDFETKHRLDEADVFVGEPSGRKIKNPNKGGHEYRWQVELN